MGRREGGEGSFWHLQNQHSLIRQGSEGKMGNKSKKKKLYKTYQIR